MTESSLQVRELLHRRFESVVERLGEKTAVRFRDEVLSYRALNARANRLARYMQERGVGAGAAVGVFLEPALDSVATLLALLKIGAIYVPLDPEYPLLRLELIVRDVRPTLIVTSSKLQPVLSGCGVEQVQFDCLQRFELSGYSCRDLDTDPDPAHIAYIFFTSGTTGKPKGVTGSHANLSQYILSAVDMYRMDAGTHMPAIARFTFSISLFELLCPLLAGGSVLLLERAHVIDLPRLARTLEHVTMFHMGPSLMKRLLAYIEEHYASPQAFAGLYHVSSGGDLVRPELMERAKTVFSNAEIFVIYGCSEVACMGCTYEVARDATMTATVVGKPFPGVSVRLLDESLHAVPTGSEGEICFSGAGVTLGYLHMPELTAEKYVLIGGERFYRTGDIGRFDASGNLEMFGRRDFQIQLRGMRIELPEIDAHLNRIPGVAEAVAWALPSEVNESSLIAYIVLDSNAPADLQSIKRYLETHLPDYMVPTLFVGLDRLPLNHNLKLDRKALPAPSAENMLTSATMTAASTDIERALVAIWKSVLKLDDIGTQHDFFELGGDSLLAVNIIIEVEKRFSKRVPISVFFSAPTIANLARVIAGNDAEKSADLVVIKQGTTAAPVFCLHGALVYKTLADSFPPEQTLCALYAAEEVYYIGSINVSELVKIYSSIDVLAQRYLQAIKTYQPNGPYHLCGFSMGGVLALEIARTLIGQGETVGLVALLDCFVPGFVNRSPLRRVVFQLQKIWQGGWPYIKFVISKLVTKTLMKRSGGGAPTLFDTELRIDELRKMARAHATVGYQPRVFEQKVVLLKATERAGYEPKDPTLGWGETISNLDIYDVPGDHHGILKGASAKRIAGLLSSYLDTMRA